MSKIKILYTIPNFKTAGSQYVLKSIYKGLDKTKFKTFVLVEKFPDYFPEEIPKKEQFCILNDTSKKKYILKLIRFLRDQKIDILHSWDYKSSFLEVIACRLSGVRYLYTKKNNAWSKRWFLKSFLSSHIAYDNPGMYERFFKNSWLKYKLTFIPHGVDTNLFIHKEKKYNTNSFIIGCIGNINSNKNQLFILKTLVQLPENVKVFFYGNEDPFYRKILNDFIQKHQLKNRVFFKGFIENKQIPDAMHQFDLFVLASINEGLPLCILEAMACGVPVLSSDSGGGAKFLLEENQAGLIFSLENEQQLIGQILELKEKDSETYTKLVDKGMEHVNKHFTIEKEVLAYTTLYKKLVK